MEAYTQITLDEWVQWKEDIRQKLAETAGNFVYIGYRLKQIRDSGMYGGEADIFAFAQKEYGLGKSTVSRFIAINGRYSEGGNSLELKEEFRGFSSSKLAEMLTLPDSEIGLVTEKTTIREIRELKTFNSQMPEESGEAAGSGSGQTPLGKCIVDYFKDKKEMLNGVMGYMGKEPPAYKEAAELMAPAQTSHRKGIVFLFLYDWGTGIKYKMMTEPEPVSMDWTAFLDVVHGIFGGSGQMDAWGAFYGETEGDGEDVEGQADSASAESGQKPEAVATSQQEEAGGQEAVDIGTEEEREETEEDADADNSGEQAGGHTDAAEHGNDEDGTDGGAGSGGAGSGEDREGGTGEPDAGAVTEEIEGQLNITDYPEYLPDTAAGGRKDTVAAGVVEEPERPGKITVEAGAAAGMEGPAIIDLDGMVQHTENQKKIMLEDLEMMRMQCIHNNWNGLIERAKQIITRAEGIRNMEEVWNG